MNERVEVYNHEALEKEIERLSREARVYRSETQAEREAVKRMVAEKIHEEKQRIPKERPSIVPAYLELSVPEIKLEVERLVDKAWHNGVSAVLSEARKSGVLILDAFHDTLTDKLYSEFKQRGLLRPRPGAFLLGVIGAVAAAFLIILLIVLL